MEMQHWTAPDVDVRCTDEPMYRHYVVITVLRCNYVTLRYVTLGFRILHCNAQPCSRRAPTPLYVKPGGGVPRGRSL